jgi:ligand-binding SRPBCC domain-containing protein
VEHVFEGSLDLNLSRDEVFAFFSDAGNLERITPPELHFHITSPLPIDLKAGAIIDYQLRLFFVPFSWQTRIAVWEPPRLFVDEQARGPYALWVHTHTFEALDTRRTRIHDQVRYRLPLSPLGDLFHPLIRRQIARIFSFRERAVTSLLAGPGPGG